MIAAGHVRMHYQNGHVEGPEAMMLPYKPCPFEKNGRVFKWSRNIKGAERIIFEDWLRSDAEFGTAISPIHGYVIVDSFALYIDSENEIWKLTPDEHFKKFGWA